MARVFKRKDRLSAMSEINITSLLDLVFCLLIIFMITTPLLEQTIPVNLPTQSRDPSADRNPKLKYVSVTVSKEGQYYYEKDLVTLDELGVKLKALTAQPDPPVVSVRGDESVPYGAVYKVYTLLKQNNLKQIDLDAQVK